jgi:hypothetical protein
MSNCTELIFDGFSSNPGWGATDLFEGWYSGATDGSHTIKVINGWNSTSALTWARTEHLPNTGWLAV